MGLITRTEFKEYLNLTTAEHDTFIKNLIDYISGAVETYCDRTFDSDSYTDYHDGTPNDGRLYLNNNVIVSVSGIYYDTTYAYGASTEISSDYYTVINANREDSYVFFKNINYSPYPNALKVSYTAGYTTVPDAIKFVVLNEAIRHYKQRKNPAISSMTNDTYGESVMLDALLPVSLEILDRYRKIGAC